MGAENITSSPEDDHTSSTDPTSSTNPTSFIPLFLSINYSIICAFGLLGNGLVIVIFAFYEKKKKLMDVLLLNMAVADVLFLCTFPFLIWAAQEKWTLGVIMCKVVMGMYRVNLYTSMFTLTAITLDRFLSIVILVRTQKYNQLKHRWSGEICGAIWVTAFLTTIPQYIFFTVEDNLCFEDYLYPNTKKLLCSFPLTIGFFLPLVAMLVCYTFILKTLIRVKSLQKRKSIRIVLAVVAVFIVTQLPYNVTLMIFTFTESDLDYDLLDVLVLMEALAYTHACLNPLLYVFLASKSRNNFWKMLRDLRLVKGRAEPSQESEDSSKAVTASTHMEAFSMVQAE